MPHSLKWNIRKRCRKWLDYQCCACWWLLPVSWSRWWLHQRQLSRFRTETRCLTRLSRAWSRWKWPGKVIKGRFVGLDVWWRQFVVHDLVVDSKLVLKWQKLNSVVFQWSDQSNFHRTSPYGNPYGNPPREEIYRVHRTLDNLGGGYLLKRSLEPLGGGYLLKRALSDSSKGTLDSLGGGYLL